MLPTSSDVLHAPLREQLEAFLDEHRAGLESTLDGVTEDEARRSLVPSRTTLLGLVKHVTFVERVWFDEAITGRSRSEIGIPETAEASFVLADHDTVETVLASYRAVCAESRAAVAGIELDDLLTGNRRGALPLRWVYLHMLRELAQHCGHADILREQVVAARTAQALVDDVGAGRR